jgi:hypothetical protein
MGSLNQANGPLQTYWGRIVVQAVAGSNPVAHPS